MLPRIEGLRVRVPAWTDAWLRGETVGEVIQLHRHWLMKQQRMSNPLARIRFASRRIEVVPLDDCEVERDRL